MRGRSKRWMTAVAAGLVAAASASPAAAQDTAAWDRVLRAHAHEGGFDYAGLRADATASAELHTFVVSLATMPQDAPLSAWLNAYNALVITQVMEHYPLASVKEVSGFFDATPHRVAGQDRTLDAIENQVVRARFHDARVHAALNCAARSCPPLHPRAFREADLDATLTALARAFVRHDARVVGGSLELSKIFEWFAADFARDGGSLLGWLRRYGPAGRFGSITEQTPIRYRPYDWRLNDRPVTRSRP